MYRAIAGIAAALLIASGSAAMAAPASPQPTPSGEGAPPGDAAAACAALARTNFTATPDAPFVAVTAVVKPATADAPALCQVEGNIAPTTGYRMWLPLATWNGKLAQSGCGGRCGGVIESGCEIMAARGYACIASDLGHRGTQYDTIWATNNLQGQIDFGFRSTHVANIAGRVLTKAFYGREPKWVYYVGASTGGRQGLVAAQKFPNDFNGVIAGEPAMGYALDRGAMRRPAWPDSVNGAAAPLFADGKAILSPAELTWLNTRAIAACDLDDRLRDGIISDPLKCRFDPAETLCKPGQTAGCLTPAQVDAVRAVYAAGPLPGSEKAWIGAYVAPDGSLGRYGPTKSPTLVDPYAWIFFDATNPDLEAFKAAGGKLIVYQGWADDATFPQNPIHYYQLVERLMGGRAATQAFFRLYMIPGQAHFPTNGGAETVDYLSYLEAWVERGQAPDVLLAAKLKVHKRFAGPLTFADDLARPDNIAFTRPVYPYPVQAQYKGKGDPDAADSFGPVTPK